MHSILKRSPGLRYHGDRGSRRVLRRVSKPVKEFGTSELLLLQQTMVYEAKRYERDNPGKLCLGLAAPQVGKNLRVIMIRDLLNEFYQGWTFMFNPTYDGTEGDMQVESEGCLSIPFFTGKTVRPEISLFHYYNAKGERVPASGSLQARGVYAQAICHEIDHLNGILYIDNAVELKMLDEYAEALKEGMINDDSTDDDGPTGCCVSVHDTGSDVDESAGLEMRVHGSYRRESDSNEDL